MDSTKINKKIILLTNLILVLIFLVLCVISIQYLQSFNFFYYESISKTNIFRFILVVTIVICIIILVIFNEIINLTKKEADAKIAEQRLLDSQELIQVLRSNQHDFLNHLQVIYSAAQLGKLDKINEYFHNITKQVTELEGISRIAYPEIAALLYSKIAKAEELLVKVTITINTDLKQIHISPFDLSRILGNLLDNAIYEMKEVVVDKRELQIKIIEDEKGFTFTIFNRFPIIPESLQEKIFEAGYTTKGDEGSGLGLHNVKDLVAKNHGSIKLISNVDEGTSFIVNFEN